MPNDELFYLLASYCRWAEYSQQKRCDVCRTNDFEVCEIDNCKFVYELQKYVGELNV